MSSKAFSLEKAFIANVAELFRYLDTLNVPKLSKALDFEKDLKKSSKNNNTLKSTYSAATNVYCIFQDQILPCINALCHLHTVKNMSIAQIFHERLVKSLTKEFFTEAKAQHYIGLLQFFQKTLDFISLDKRKMMADVTIAVLNHLNTYTIDPDSAVVGLIPNDDLLNKISRDYEMARLDEKVSEKEEEYLFGKDKDKDKDKEKEKEKDGLSSLSITSATSALSMIMKSNDSNSTSSSSNNNNNSNSNSKDNNLSSLNNTSLNSAGFSILMNSTTSTGSNNRDSYYSVSSVTANNNNNSGGGNILGSNLNSPIPTISTSRTSLLMNIINWSALDDINQIAKSVRRYASLLRGCDKIKKGDLVIVRFNQYQQNSHKKTFIGGFKVNHQINNSNGTLSPSPTLQDISNNNNNHHHQNQLPTHKNKSIITLEEYFEKLTTSQNQSPLSNPFRPKAQFARYTGEREDYYIKVYFSSEENEEVLVGIEDVLVLNKFTIESLKDIKLADKMICHPSEKFFSQVLEETKHLTISSLENLGVDLDFIHNVLQNSNINNLARIKVMHNTLVNIFNNPDHLLFKDLEKSISEKIELYLNHQLDMRFMYIPRYDNTVNELKSSSYLQISKSKVKQALGECELAVDRLRVEKVLYMNGTKKEQITEWWLKRIETRCNEFLSERGYNFSAVPENYIEQPPNNINDVFSNLMLIQKILDPQEQMIEIITIEEDNKKEDNGNNSNKKDTITITSSSLPSTPTKLSESSGSINIPLSGSTGKLNRSGSVVIKSPPKENLTGRQPSPSCSFMSTSSTSSNQSLPINSNNSNNINDNSSSNSGNSSNLNLIQNSANSSSQSLLSIPIQNINSLTLSNKFFSSPIPLIKELKEEIYPVIHDFVKKCQIILADHFKLEQFSSSTIKQLLKESRESNSLDHSNLNYFEDMISDLDYLTEMERLEDAKNERSLHIVPIGGLVMGTFARLENELNTVMELWNEGSDDDQEENDSNNNSNPITTSLDSSGGTLTLTVTKKQPQRFDEGKSLLHVTINTDDVDQVEKVLLTEAYSINDVDVNGWTPLHSACCLGNADIVKLLLQVDDIDVTIKNKDGASVLHYLVRHPLTEKRKEAIIEIIKKGLDISVGSRHGETPLHSASFRGHNDVVIFLIQNGANINAITAGRETSLHYAVTAGRANIVSTLLQNGAQWNIVSKRGTPIDLARNAKLTNIVQLLENGPDVNNFEWRKQNKTLLQQQKEMQILRQQQLPKHSNYHEYRKNQEEFNQQFNLHQAQASLPNLNKNSNNSSSNNNNRELESNNNSNSNNNNITDNVNIYNNNNNSGDNNNIVTNQSISSNDLIIRRCKFAIGGSRVNIGKSERTSSISKTTQTSFTPISPNLNNNNINNNNNNSTSNNNTNISNNKILVTNNNNNNSNNNTSTNNNNNNPSLINDAFLEAVSSLPPPPTTITPRK